MLQLMPGAHQRRGGVIHFQLNQCLIRRTGIKLFEQTTKIRGVQLAELGQFVQRMETTEVLIERGPSMQISFKRATRFGGIGKIRLGDLLDKQLQKRSTNVTGHRGAQRAVVNQHLHDFRDVAPWRQTAGGPVVETRLSQQIPGSSACEIHKILGRRVNGVSTNGACDRSQDAIILVMM